VTKKLFEKAGEIPQKLKKNLGGGKSGKREVIKRSGRGLILLFTANA